MKNILSRIFFPTFFIAAAITFWSWKKSAEPDRIVYLKPTPTPIAMCGSFSYDLGDTTARATLLPGLGPHRYPISTKSLKAQEFFEQGLKLVYAFNHWEAIQAFREAARLDPDCGMAYWGLALAYGPNLNDINPKDRERIAYESIQKAISKKDRVSPVEKDMIDAMAARYDGNAYDVRDSLNSLYAQAMLKIAAKYPDDAEVQTLAADAVMNTMPWDYWQKDGSPKPPTAEAKKILEAVLKKSPNHPGAHHLYIHLVEASPAPEQALASATFLETAMPGAGHIIHMPAHIYIRTGNYARSVELNQQAVKVDEDYLSQSGNKGMYRWSYYPHNVDFISFSSYMEGRSGLGIQSALKLAYKGSMITQSNPIAAQYFDVEPMLAYVRFGKWNDILSLPDPDASLVYSNVIYRFARGMAHLRANRIAQASVELSKLDSLTQLDTLRSIYFTFNPASDVVQVPLHILRGELAIKQNRFDEGVAFLTRAVEVESNLRYMEPPDWKIPSRHFLGAAFLDAGKFAEAEQVYLKDLQINRENGWSLNGLQQCQLKLGKKAEMSATAKRFTKAWKNADVAITSSRY